MFRRICTAIISRLYSKSAKGSSKGSCPPPSPQKPLATCPAPSNINTNVAGLSEKVVKKITGPTGFMGASQSGEYKVPEYFSFHRMSYFEAEIELAKYRLPQPSAEK